MSLELAPETESTIRASASHAGLSENDYLARLIQVAPLHLVMAEGSSDTRQDTAKQRIATMKQKIAQWQHQYGVPQSEEEPKTLTVLRAEWSQEGGVMTSDQVQAERGFWEEFHQDREGVRL
jgi:hypothetical protein